MPTSQLIDEPTSEIRVIAPSYMWEPGFEERDHKAVDRLSELGFKVTFGEHLKAPEFHLGTASVTEKVSDFHAAFTDQNVKIVMAYSGGWSANELLPLINWDLVKSNPKPLTGYSDITVLINAIYAKTGIICYLGPNFGTFGLESSWQYTLENFQKVISRKSSVDISPSMAWVNADGETVNNQDWKIIQDGQAEGKLIGGNFNTFHLLQGTEYQPKFNEPFILIAEDDDESGALTARYFSRRLESILQLPGVRQNLQGILIGRFLAASQFHIDDVEKVIASKNLGNIPVVANMDFGHTLPLLTLPIGGGAIITAQNGEAKLTIL